MLALGIDTSTPRVSVALVEKEPLPPSDLPRVTSPPAVIAQRDCMAENRHGEVLATLIDELFDEAGTAPARLCAVGVGLGPGPFTGLRVGIATAAAMSDALGIPAYGVCSLDIVGRQHAMDEEPLAVIFDARRRQVYWAVYNEVGGRIEGPEIGAPRDLADYLRGKVSEVVGPGATRYAEAFSDFRVAETRWPDAADIARTAWGRRQHDSPGDRLTPLYLRRPDVREPGPPKRVTPS